MEQGTEASGLRDFLTVLFKHKSTILLTFFAVVATVTVGSFVLPPTYEAQSRLLVKFGRENIYRPEVGGDRNPVFFFNQEEVLNSEIKILTSRDLIERVITTLTVERMYPKFVENPPRSLTPLDAAIERFDKDLSVEGVRKSNVIEISFQHKDPRMAAKALDLLMNFFKEKHLQAYSDPKSSFLEQQLLVYEQQLKKSQNSLEAFKQKNRVFSLEEQRSLLLKQRTELDTTLKSTENQAREIRERLASFRRQMQSVPEDVPLQIDTELYRGVDDAKTELLRLQLKEQELLQKYKETSPLIVNVRKEIQIVQGSIKEQEEGIKGRVRTGKNIVYQDLEREMIKVQAELPSQGAKAAALRGQVAQLDSEIQTLDLREKELENLKRDIAVNDKNYKTYLDKVEEARISEDLNRQKMSNISVIQEATVPAKPFKPKKLLNIVLGVILGAVSGLGFAFFKEYTGQGLSTPESAEQRLGLPVLATVALKH
jgi:polysaccharide chain length determinant protein (PEP-CTERM system associated)